MYPCVHTFPPKKGGSLLFSQILDPRVPEEIFNSSPYPQHPASKKINARNSGIRGDMNGHHSTLVWEKRSLNPN